MTADEVTDRIERIYAAMGAVEESDLSKFPPQVLLSEDFVALHSNFAGDLAPAEISNLAHSAIHNIANLKDHVRGWLAACGKDRKAADAIVSNSLAIQIIIGLSNNDKHGLNNRQGGLSKRQPRLTDVRRTLRLTTLPEGGSGVSMTFGPSGPVQVAGTGTAKVIVTGRVVDNHGQSVGDLHDFQIAALEAWEHGLKRLGLFT